MWVVTIAIGIVLVHNARKSFSDRAGSGQAGGIWSDPQLAWPQLGATSWREGRESDGDRVRFVLIGKAGKFPITASGHSPRLERIKTSMARIGCINDHTTATSTK